ncbi:MAG: hypothetical protein IPN07_16320 [Dehalococcoidia bacterium]|nr:hypothetical protein [Dehalococcoidia bacterium]
MTAMPPDLERLLEDFKLAERSERIDMLIEYADRFEEVPGHIASRPFPEDHHVQKCESEAYVWAEDQPDGTLKYYFAVENPQGISAKAWSVYDRLRAATPPGTRGAHPHRRALGRRRTGEPSSLRSAIFPLWAAAIATLQRRLRQRSLLCLP